MSDYENFITELVQKHKLVLGPNIALDTARAVKGLKVADDGKVQRVFGDEALVLKALLNGYGSLVHQISQKIADDLQKKYPSVNLT